VENWTKLAQQTERGADLHMAQLMPLPITVSCFSKIQIGFTFLVPAHPGSPGKRAVKWVCVYSLTINHKWIFISHSPFFEREIELTVVPI